MTMEVHEKRLLNELEQKQKDFHLEQKNTFRMIYNIMKDYEAESIVLQSVGGGNSEKASLIQGDISGQSIV